MTKACRDGCAEGRANEVDPEFRDIVVVDHCRSQTARWVDGSAADVNACIFRASVSLSQLAYQTFGAFPCTYRQGE